MVSLWQLISWLIVGALAGSLAGWLVTSRRQGFGMPVNLAIGLLGGIVGGFLFNALNIPLLGLEALQISARDIVAAFVGSLILLGVLTLIRRR